MNKEELNSILKDALRELKSKDIYLIEHDVHEQSISSKLACYLSQRILTIDKGGWHVDVEYNRNGERPKGFSSGEHFRSDIIIHRRGENNPKGTEDNNLLVIEIKKNSGDRKADCDKIQGLIGSAPYYYCFGAFIDLSNTNLEDRIEWFERDIAS